MLVVIAMPHALPAQDSTEYIRPERIEYQGYQAIKFNPLGFHPIDTGFSKSFDYDWTKTRFGIGSTTTGEGPTQVYDFQPSLKNGPSSGMDGARGRMLTRDDVKLYNTRRPFFDFSYLQGPPTFQVLEGTHARNISPRWSMNFYYKRHEVRGFLQNAHRNQISTWAASNYLSKSNRLAITAGGVWNVNESGQNGGLASDSTFPDASIVNLGGQPVRRLNAQSRFSTQEYFARTTLFMGTPDTSAPDSIGLVIKPRWSIGHELAVNIERYYYTDRGELRSFYSQLLYDTGKIYFRYPFLTITNSFSLSNAVAQPVRDSASSSPYTAEAGISHTYFEALPGYADTAGHDFVLSGSLAAPLGGGSLMAIEASYHPIGSLSGNYAADAIFGYAPFASQPKLRINAQIGLQKAAPQIKDVYLHSQVWI